MPAKKGIRILGLIIFLGLLAVAILHLVSKPSGTLVAAARSITLRQPDRIDRIILRSGSDSTYLVKHDSIWIAGGMEKARDVAVQNILYAAEQLSIISVLSYDQITEDRNETSVSYYSKDRLVLEYGVFMNNDRFIIHNPGSDHYYMVRLSGYENISLDRIFSPSTNHYLENLLIDLLPSELEYLEIELPGKGWFSFEQDSNGNYTCKDLKRGIMVPQDSMEDLSVRLLFSYFTDIRYEEKYLEHQTDDFKREMGSKKLANLKVMSRGGEHHQLEVYPYLEKPGGQAHMFRAVVCYNNYPDLLFINYIFLDVLMRDLEHYMADKGAAEL